MPLTFTETPLYYKNSQWQLASRKSAVDVILRQDVEDGRITAERYTKITGTPYN